MNIEHIDHTEYPKRIKRLTVAELQYTIQDCQEALQANPQGGKAGYYADEIAYCGMELKKRGY